MKVNVEEKNSVQRLLTVEIPGQEVKKTVDKIYRRLGRQARIKGFRPGKAPRSILEKYYGPQVAAETAEGLLADYYPKALEEADLEPLARPEFDFDLPEAGKDFVFKVTLDVRPEFELEASQYQGLKLKEPDLKVTTEEVNQQLDALRERQAVLIAVEEDRPAEIGDVLVVDYRAFVDDEPLEGGQAENVEIELGGGNTRPEIETALVKARVGEVVEARVEQPEDSSNKDLAGKTIRYQITVKELKQKVLPQLDDDFARSLSPEIESLEMLIERIKEDIEQRYQQEKETALRTQIRDQVRELGEFDTPQSLVEAEAREMLESFKQRMAQSGMDLSQAGLDEEKWLERFRPEAEKKVRTGIVLARIAEKENIEVEEKDIEDHFAKVAEDVGQPAEAIRQIYLKNNMMPSLNAQLLEEKTLQALKAAAIIEVVDPAELAPKEQDAAQAENDSEETKQA